MHGRKISALGRFASTVAICASIIAKVLSNLDGRKVLPRVRILAPVKFSLRTLHRTGERILFPKGRITTLLPVLFLFETLESAAYQ